jgi:hypothetical protein
MEGMSDSSQAKGYYDVDTNAIHMQDPNNKAVGFHELTHASGFDIKVGEELGSQRYNPDKGEYEDYGIAKRKIKGKDEKGGDQYEEYGILGNPYKQEGKNIDSVYQKYFKDPTEKYGNLNELRVNLGLKPGQKIDEETLRKLVKEKQLHNENFFRTFSDKNIIEALNTVAFQGQGSNNDYDNYRSNRIMNA